MKYSKFLVPTLLYFKGFFGNLDQQVKNYFGPKIDGLYQCKACGRAEKFHSNLRYHVELKHYSPGYSCQNCGKTFQVNQNCTKHQKLCFLK